MELTLVTLLFWVLEFKHEVKRLEKLNPDWYVNKPYEEACTLKHLLKTGRGNCCSWAELCAYIAGQHGLHSTRMTMRFTDGSAHRITITMDKGTLWLQSNRNIWPCHSMEDVYKRLHKEWPGQWQIESRW